MAGSPRSALKPAPKPDWARRWTVIRAVLGFCASLAAWITLFGPDDRLRETALLGAFGLAGAVALGYLGFATQDDRNWLAHWSELRLGSEPRIGPGAGPVAGRSREGAS